MNWNNIINLEQLQFEAEEMGAYKNEHCSLSSKMGAKKLGFHVEVLPPQAFSSPYHFHYSEEELFLVLEGKAMLRQANHFKEVSQGDLIFFVNLPEGAHQFYNHTDQSFRFLALSTKDPLDICEYPDSEKISVNSLSKVFKIDSEVDYFKDEEHPRRNWPSEHLRR